MIDHSWMENVLCCSDARINAAYANEDGELAEREMDAAWLLDPVRFVSTSFDNP